jgi:hypothetical protein
VTDFGGNKDGSEVSYVQLAHNVWDPVRQRSITMVIHNFGREDAMRFSFGPATV